MKVLLLIAALAVFSSCGPDPDEIVKQENTKLNNMQPVEAAKAEEAMMRIREESEIIAKGGVLPAVKDTLAQDTTLVATPAPAPRPAPPQTPAATTPQGSVPHHIQLGAYSSAAGAKSAAELWEKRGYQNVIHMENPAATTEYRFVVRLTGYDGYTSALTEARKINAEYGIGSYPLQIRR